MSASQTFARGVDAYKDGRYREASRLCAQALDEATSAESLDVSIYALHMWLAKINFQLGDYEAVKRSLDNASKCANKHIDEKDLKEYAAIADLECAQWRLDSQLGQHFEAISGIADLVARQKKHSDVDSLEYANALNAQGIIFCEAGQAEDAAAPLRRSMSIRERLIGTDTVAFADSLSNLSVNYSLQNNFTVAGALSDRALTLLRQLLRADHPLIANCLYNRAGVYLRTLRAKKAEEDFKDALKIFEQELPSQHRQISLTLSGLGHAMLGQHKFKDAISPFQRALEIAEKTKVQKDILLSSALAGLGQAYLGVLQFKEAEPYFKRALYLVEHSEELKVASERNLLDSVMISCLFQGKVGDVLRHYPDSMRAKYTSSAQGVIGLVDAVVDFAKKQLPSRDDV